MGPVSLRPFRPGDEADLVSAADHREVWINLRDRFPHPYTPADARAWIEHTAGAAPTDWAIALEDRVVGGIGVVPGVDVHRHTGEVGYWLGPEVWGKGLATAALSTFAPWAAAHFGFVRLFAMVKVWNPASMRVLEKCGFEREGLARRVAFKDGRHVDGALYARLFDGPGVGPA
jgi:[ribosomal protein S5]-alanine N-acetyltransferase